VSKIPDINIKIQPMKNLEKHIPEGFKTKEDRESAYKTRIICYYNMGIEHEYLSQFKESQNAFSKALELTYRLSNGISFIQGSVKETFLDGTKDLEQLITFSFSKITQKLFKKSVRPKSKNRSIGISHVSRKQNLLNNLCKFLWNNYIAQTRNSSMSKPLLSNRIRTGYSTRRKNPINMA
jgi:hypothetical protein